MIDRRQFIGCGMASAAAWPVRAQAGRALVAVAASFVKPAEKLAALFYQETGGEITITSGATGLLYSQITNGAPYDAFLAADQARPSLLMQSGLGQRQFTYARGLLALYAPQEMATETSLHGGFSHLAIANPALAPYGVAARQTLEALGLWAQVSARIVQGQNVAQAYALVASGNAELGLIARAYALERSWLVPSHLYAPLYQDAVLLGENPVAVAFLIFLSSAHAKAMIAAAGFGAP